SYSLKEHPASPEFEAEGSWQLEPFEDSLGFLGDYYTTGVMDIKKKKDGNFDFEISIIMNAKQGANSLYQREFTYKDVRDLQTSSREIVSPSVLELVRFREYNGSAGNLTDWNESKFSPWEEDEFRGQSGSATMKRNVENCAKLADMYCRRKIRLDLVDKDTLRFSTNVLKTPGQDLVFRKIKKPTSEKKSISPRLLGSVFLVQKDKKTITITGNRVSEKLVPGRSVVISKDGKVIGRGTVQEIFPTYAKVKISSGMEMIEPRMNAIVY
ncbi:MAG: hypothetical protein JJT78_17895, partial [Leptospira sp.]|nr:hypothetical protein [Leptospira sp.]